MQHLPSIPRSWSSLTWQQLCRMWAVKLAYGGEPDAAVCAAWLDLMGLTVAGHEANDPVSGETVYLLLDGNGQRWKATPRQIAGLAKSTMTWFDYPYGDQGQEEKKDDKGNVVQEARKAHIGYVSNLRDALMLSVETVAVGKSRVVIADGRKWWRMPMARVFALPQTACNNLTWQQYRALQAITPRLWSSDVSDDEIVSLQAQFLANILVPRSVALLDQSGDTVRLRPHFTYKYNVEQADTLVSYWRRKLLTGSMDIITLFHVCHQVWQTALVYYSRAYPLLFADEGKSDPMHDALQGEVGTVNTIMKYAGYAEQQQVYDSNLPFIFDILNTMTKEAKEIEEMNAKYK